MQPGRSHSLLNSTDSYISHGSTKRKDWRMDDWHKVVWSDESKFNVFGSDGRVYIRRRVGEDYLLVVCAVNS